MFLYFSLILFVLPLVLCNTIMTSENCFLSSDSDAIFRCLNTGYVVGPILGSLDIGCILVNKSAFDSNSVKRFGINDDTVLCPTKVPEINITDVYVDHGSWSSPIEKPDVGIYAAGICGNASVIECESILSSSDYQCATRIEERINGNLYRSCVAAEVSERVSQVTYFGVREIGKGPIIKIGYNIAGVAGYTTYSINTKSSDGYIGVSDFHHSSSTPLPSDIDIVEIANDIYLTQNEVNLHNIGHCGRLSVRCVDNVPTLANVNNRTVLPSYYSIATSEGSVSVKEQFSLVGELKFAFNDYMRISDPIVTKSSLILNCDWKVTNYRGLNLGNAKKIQYDKYLGISSKTQLPVWEFEEVYVPKGNFSIDFKTIEMLSLCYKQNGKTICIYAQGACLSDKNDHKERVNIAIGQGVAEMSDVPITIKTDDDKSFWTWSLVLSTFSAMLGVVGIAYIVVGRVRYNRALANHKKNDNASSDYASVL